MVLVVFREVEGSAQSFLIELKMWYYTSPLVWGTCSVCPGIQEERIMEGSVPLLHLPFLLLLLGFWKERGGKWVQHLPWGLVLVLDSGILFRYVGMYIWGANLHRVFSLQYQLYPFPQSISYMAQFHSNKVRFSQPESKFLVRVATRWLKINSLPLYFPGPGKLRLCILASLCRLPHGCLQSLLHHPSPASPSSSINTREEQQARFINRGSSWPSLCLPCLFKILVLSFLSLKNNYFR